MLINLTPEELERLISLLKPGNIFKDEYSSIYKKLEELDKLQGGKS